MGRASYDASTAAGLTFSLLPDRAWTSGWRPSTAAPSPGSAERAPPADFGLPWLRQFNGGLLVTCGLTHVGPPETDPQSGEQRAIHGRYSLLRASEIAVTRGWERESDGT
jgi:hypothetical protein